MLGELPLALDQAAAYIGSKKTQFSDFRKKLKDAMKIRFRKRLLDPSLSAQKDSVLTTWELSFQELSNDACHLLHMCAFLSNEDIPEELFRRGKSAVAWMMEDEERLDDAIENLLTFSLIKRKESTDIFWIHPLIHTWAREWTNSTIRRQNVEDAVTLVASAIVVDSHKKLPDDWIFEQRILNHLNGRYEEALDLYQRALAGYEKTLRKDHPSTLTTVHAIALVFDEALEFYQRTLVGSEKSLGKDHPSTLTTVNCMALRALVGSEKALGKDHPDTLATVHCMAVFFEKQGCSEEALNLFEKALARREKALGREHPHTLLTVGWIEKQSMILMQANVYVASSTLVSRCPGELNREMKINSAEGALELLLQIGPILKD
ncbi:hypothetical protein RUND412_001677 [Rhizina undulata]